jgi:caa(3)-type oxidase subunit IV
VALAISVIKKTVIVIYFMRARRGDWLTRVVIGTGALCFGLLLGLTMGDYRTRGLG